MIGRVRVAIDHAGSVVGRAGSAIGGDLLLAAAIALAGVAIVVLAPGLTAPRIVAGVALVLVAPGYAIVAALFGRERQEPALVALLTLALSVANAICVALALHVAGIALSASALALALASVCLAATAIAARRGRPHDGWPPRALVRPWTAPLVVLLAVFAVAFGLLRAPLPNPHVAGYTALGAQRSTPETAIVWVRSQERSPQRYRLHAIAFDRRGGWHTIGRVSRTLRPGGSWRSEFRTAPAGHAKRVTVRLYRATQPARAYRRVTLSP